jgi:hypothetical protein
LEDKLLKIGNLELVEAAGVERFFHSLDSITYLFSVAYRKAKKAKMPFPWYSFGTVFDSKNAADRPPPPAFVKSSEIRPRTAQW